jgi:hypothetical protein
MSGFTPSLMRLMRNNYPLRERFFAYILYLSKNCLYEIKVFHTCIAHLPAVLQRRFFPKSRERGIPDEFNCTGCILVILKKESDSNTDKREAKMNDRMNELFEDKFIKNYDGKTVFVTEKELNTDTLYADKNVYRFFLLGTMYAVAGSIAVDRGNGPGTFNYTSAALKLQFYDRLKGKWYGQLSNWPTWAKNMEKVAEALNKLLKK